MYKFYSIKGMQWVVTKGSQNENGRRRNWKTLQRRTSYKTDRFGGKALHKKILSHFDKDDYGWRNSFMTEVPII